MTREFLSHLHFTFISTRRDMMYHKGLMDKNKVDGLSDAMQNWNYRYHKNSIYTLQAVLHGKLSEWEFLGMISNELKWKLWDDVDKMTNCYAERVEKA